MTVYNQALRVGIWAERILSPESWPVTVGLDLSDRCTLSCPHCAFDHPRQDMDPCLAKRLITEASHFAESITLAGGGEPLMNPHALEIIDHAVQHGLLVGLTTNGLALSQKKTRFLSSNCAWIRVSVDAADRERYAQRHGADVFDRIVEKMAFLGSLQGNAYTSMGFLVCPDTTPEEMEAAADLAKRSQMDAIAFRPLWAKGQAIDFTDHAEEIRAKLASDVFQVLWPSRTRYISDPSMKRPSRCWAGTTLNIKITADGRAWPCGHLRYKEGFCLGDTTGPVMETLFKIWRSERRWNIQSRLPDEGVCPWPCCYATQNILAEQLMEDVENAFPHCYFA